VSSLVLNWLRRFFRIGIVGVACWFCFLTLRERDATRVFESRANAIEASIREQSVMADSRKLTLTSLMANSEEIFYFYNLPQWYSLRFRLESDEGSEELAAVSAHGLASSGVLHFRLGGFSLRGRSCKSLEFYTVATGFKEFSLISDADGWLECSEVYLEPQVLLKMQSVLKTFSHLAARPENNRVPGFRLGRINPPPLKNWIIGPEDVCVLASFYRTRMIEKSQSENPAMVTIAMVRD
jgi:hypothetical protein